MDHKREPIYVLTRSIVIPFMHVWFRWHIEGLTNIPSSGPAIIASNHIAYLDPLAIGYAVDRAGRRPRFLAKSELFADKKVAWVLRGCGQIEVQRGSRAAPVALDQALDALDRGEVIVIFPEGTVTTNDDLSPMPPKTGVVRLALKSGVPVLPCAVWGTANVWPKGYRHDWRPGRDIALAVGQPIQTTGDMSNRDDWERAGRTIMDEVAGLVAGLKPLIEDRRRPRKPSKAAT
jgi:1-acyl-sn-glycerol-3-phosphate acyltransferase